PRIKKRIGLEGVEKRNSPSIFCGNSIREPLKTLGFSKIFAAAGVGISRRHLASMLSGSLREYF
ncbi:MAG: hypothetical protein OET79_08945, partial [Nitrospirota bacterium]|nr:hypothetical protein [Nitrospirota bacterium]